MDVGVNCISVACLGACGVTLLVRPAVQMQMQQRSQQKKKNHANQENVLPSVHSSINSDVHVCLTRVSRTVNAYINYSHVCLGNV